MRIEIKINQQVPYTEVRALYVISYALKLLSPSMVIPTLEFFAGRYGFRLFKELRPKER